MALASLARVTDRVNAPVQRVLAQPVAGPAIKGVLAAVTVFVVATQSWGFGAPNSIVVGGLSIGVLYGLIGVSVILIYRTNRIINFGAAGIGAVPGVTGVFLIVNWGWSWYVAFPIALVGGFVLGGLIDFVVIRRFARAPRLILTVATIGISQLLAFIAIYIPQWIEGDDVGFNSAIKTPFSTSFFQIGDRPFSYDYIFAVFMVGLLVAGLAAFFRFTRIGIALRASAENADRASLLGIPVRRVGTVAWAIAGLFAATTIFLRASLVGVPVDGTLGATVLLYALAAAVIARMESIPLCMAAGVAIGTLDQASVFKTGSNSVAGAIMLVGILGALIVQRTSLSRAQDSGVSTWQAVKEFRPIPAELKNVREVRIAKAVLATVVGLLFLFAPMIVGDGRVGLLGLIPIYAIVAVSLVILTGWAGQISLGQFGIVGIAACVGGGLAANHNIDFFLALLAGIVAGTIFSIIIGIPALRVQGLYLAVTTLAFAAAVQGFFLRPDYPFGQAFRPDEGARIERPKLWQRIDLGTESELNLFGRRISFLPDTKFYYLCLVFLGITILAARAYRRNRSGRVLIAIRDNARAAPSYGINLATNRLAAFAISGAIASLGGVLLAYQQGAIDPSVYGIGPSIGIFVITVVGGLTALPGAVLGAVVIQGLEYFGEEILEGFSLLVTGPGLLVILLFLPGGFAEGMYKVRDIFLRTVANRNGIMVPSLFADRRVDDAKTTAIEDAEHKVEAVGFDVLAGPTVTCPVCEEVMTADVAPDHEHFKSLAKAGG